MPDHKTGCVIIHLILYSPGGGKKSHQTKKTLWCSLLRLVYLQALKFQHSCLNKLHSLGEGKSNAVLVTIPTREWWDMGHGTCWVFLTHLLPVYGHPDPLLRAVRLHGLVLQNCLSKSMLQSPKSGVESSKHKPLIFLLTACLCHPCPALPYLLEVKVSLAWGWTEKWDCGGTFGCATCIWL